jgi:16S rRNA (adenine1518-N6/adenine1519-N6)-dimethyltransferase
MPIYKPSELHHFLTQLGISPKKVLSQNFLVDGNILNKIVATAKVSPEDIVVEVGPGPGSLTEKLLETGATVLAIEKDNVLAKTLERLKSPQKRLEIFCSDILEFPLEKILSTFLSKGQKAKLIANLPYHLTTPLISRLVSMYPFFSSLVVMIQEEVARRFTAEPGTSAYSSFTVFLHFFTYPHYAFSVSRQCFYPKPRVDSAVVILSLKEPPLVSNRDRFFEMTRTAFEQRRKMMRNSLRELYPPETVVQALLKINRDPQIRAEQLSLEEFLRVFEYLQTTPHAS